jgi:EcsC protein family
MYFSEPDHQELIAAVRRLERPSFAGRVAVLAGKPVGVVARALPAPAAALVAQATARVLEGALEIALFSLGEGRRTGGRLARGRALHSLLACASGAVGGVFGPAALVVELPVSTTIMLRAIAAIAQKEGENLADPRTGLACLEVFALGAAAPNGGDAESAYFAVRDRLARGVVEVADLALDKTAVRKGAPTVVRFLAQIASRFGVLVSEKVAAQAVAVVGALGGAAVNLAFIEHFQDLARGHFTVRRLERVYGADAVRAEYERLKSELHLASASRVLRDGAPHPPRYAKRGAPGG